MVGGQSGLIGLNVLLVVVMAQGPEVVRVITQRLNIMASHVKALHRM